MGRSADFSKRYRGPTGRRCPRATSLRISWHAETQGAALGLENSMLGHVSASGKLQTNIGPQVCYAGRGWGSRVGGCACWASCADGGGLPSSESANACAPRLSRTVLGPRDVEEVTLANLPVGCCGCSLPAVRPSGRGVEISKAYDSHGIAPSNGRCFFRRQEGWRLVARTVGACVRGWRVGRHTVEEKKSTRGRDRQASHETYDIC